ncbi:hypothetical protein EsVE80_12890 [Enterococcus saigonensis]|uniref:Uncharacterized protein n=1 Tax=Enterococcus saigonensis TaxID=1805431 RepID=A0A679IKH6_9ENTE|nr:hypothetical protein [Enterococcus saigonensis]BCA85766.1 hypothetical protein EsVE80_12890 [Enterococcus saigonensis]
MLNGYFALGVPIGLMVLYGVILFLRKKSKIPYLGFVLFIIAGFMVAFSYQVLQYAFKEQDNLLEASESLVLSYPFWLLYIPLGVGVILVIINIFRAYKRIKS